MLHHHQKPTRKKTKNQKTKLRTSPKAGKGQGIDQGIGGGGDLEPDQDTGPGHPDVGIGDADRGVGPGPGIEGGETRDRGRDVIQDPDKKQKTDPQIREGAESPNRKHQRNYPLTLRSARFMQAKLQILYRLAVLFN